MRPTRCLGHGPGRGVSSGEKWTVSVRAARDRPARERSREVSWCQQEPLPRPSVHDRRTGPMLLEEEVDRALDVHVRLDRRHVQIHVVPHRRRLLELFQERYGNDIPLIRREDVRGFMRRKPLWLSSQYDIDAIRGRAAGLVRDDGSILAVARHLDARRRYAGVLQLVCDSDRAMH